MGYYIEVPHPRNKARQLVDLYDAKIELGPFFDETGKRIGICVVENGPFDAAAIAFSKREMQEFADDDTGRPITWLSLPREIVIKLNPPVERALAPIQ